MFGAREENQGQRIYVQDLDGGAIRPISPENVVTAGLATPDGRFVLGGTINERERFLYPIDGGEPVPFRFMNPDDAALQWSRDGRLLYVWKVSWPPVVDRIDLTTGSRSHWKTMQPVDPVGLDTIDRIVMTPEGAYCHDYIRFLSELFIVEGLK